MPVNFLSEEQSLRYGSYDGEPSELQLNQYFHLDDIDFAIIENRRSNSNRLGFAIQLCTVRFLGTFLPNPIDVPPGVVTYIARQLGISDIRCLQNYMDRSSTRHEHTYKIKQVYGYKDFKEEPEYSQLLDWLNTRAWISDERPSVLFDMATAWLVKNKILLPGVTTLARIIAQVRDQAAKKLWEIVASIPNEQQKQNLEKLLLVPAGSRQSKLDKLRSGPTRVSSPALIQTLARLEEIRDLGVSNLDINHVPRGRFKSLARYAMTAWAPTIARMSEQRRIATLFAFAHSIEVVALDDSLDLLDLLITDIFNKAKSIGQRDRLRTLRDLDFAAIKLRDACSILIESTYEENILETVFSQVSREHILEAISKIDELARPQDDRYHEEVIALYGCVRRFLPALLKNIDFKGASSGQSTLQAIEFLKRMGGKRSFDIADTPLDEISRAWKRKIILPDNKVDKRAYTLCSLQRLQDGLRRRDIFCETSERWGDPRIKLLKGREWESVRDQVCQSLGKKKNAEEALQELKQNLEDAYQRTIRNFPFNNDVRIEQQANGREKLVLTTLDKLEESESLLKLRSKITERLPRVDLPEVLLEIHARTGFANEFTHISESGTRIMDLPISICAVLLSEACNIGLEPLIHPDYPALTRDRLSWVQQNYIRADTLTKANARLGRM